MPGLSVLCYVQKCNKVVLSFLFVTLITTENGHSRSRLLYCIKSVNNDLCGRYSIFFYTIQIWSKMIYLSDSALVLWNTFNWSSMYYSAFKVVALGNFKDFGIYFKMGYYLRISANKFEYLSVTRISTWLFYANIVVALYLLIINLLPCPLGPINLKNLIFCGREIKILSFFLRILQTLTLWIITSLQSTEEAEFKLSWNF